MPRFAPAQCKNNKYPTSAHGPANRIITRFAQMIATIRQNHRHRIEKQFNFLAAHTMLAAFGPVAFIPFKPVNALALLYRHVYTSINHCKAHDKTAPLWHHACMRIRPVRTDDHAAVLELARAAGIGMTSLPADADVLARKIAASVESFAGEPARKGKEAFLFVLEDPVSGEVAGTTGIKSHIGLNQPFYSYKITTITQQSRDLDLFSRHRILQVTNDLTDCSEIGSLFLLPHYRRDRLGRLLSLSRFLFMAAFPDYVAGQTIAEMRGVHDPAGNAPFYDSIARHFFEMDFARADYINATRGNQFINDLMPKYPIYVSLLPKSAQDVIGQPHPSSVPARAMLEREGFRWTGYIDIFDGGPTLQAETGQILSIRESRRAEIAAIGDQLYSEKHLMSNERFADFRCCAGRLAEEDDGRVHITSRAAAALELGIGDTLRYLSHKS